VLGIPNGSNEFGHACILRDVPGIREFLPAIGAGDSVFASITFGVIVELSRYTLLHLIPETVTGDFELRITLVTLITLLV
jgi:hypothetical protein